MIYKFLCVNRTLPAFNLCVISLNATTEEQARLCLSSDFRHIATIARINPKSHRTLNQHSPMVKVKDGTDWHHVNIHTLPKSQDVGMIQSTTTIEGTRNPYQCGFFISQIPFNGYAPLAHTYHQAEFAVRLRDRNKAHARTNKIRRSIAVVDTVSHPTTGDTFQQTKSIGNPTMKIYSQNHRTFADNARSVSAVMGVNHA